MRLSGSLGAKLDQVVVSFAKWNQANQLEQLAPLPKDLWVEADALQQCVDPFLCAEFGACVDVLVEVEAGQLNRLKRFKHPRNVSLFAELIFDVSNAPDAANQQFFVLLYRVRGNKNFVDAQIGESRLVDVFAFIQLNRDFVDDFITPLLLDR